MLPISFSVPAGRVLGPPLGTVVGPPARWPPEQRLLISWHGDYSPAQRLLPPGESARSPRQQAGACRPQWSGAGFSGERVRAGGPRRGRRRPGCSGRGRAAMVRPGRLQLGRRHPSSASRSTGEQLPRRRPVPFARHCPRSGSGCNCGGRSAVRAACLEARPKRPGEARKRLGTGDASCAVGWHDQQRIPPESPT
jgi:hypothetical protein